MSKNGMSNVQGAATMKYYGAFLVICEKTHNIPIRNIKFPQCDKHRVAS